MSIRHSRICEDIDECEQRTHTCDTRETCVNTRGSFKCLKMECPEGYSLISDRNNRK